MPVSPHQPESLTAKITRLKAELATYELTRNQVLTLGQSTSGAGGSTTYTDLAKLEVRIDHLRAQISALIAQLTGEDTQPGVNLLSHANDYNR